MDWKEQWKDKLVSAEAAAALVKSGDVVRIALGPTPPTVTAALAARRNELKDVTIWQPSASHVPGVEWWRELGWEPNFHSITEFPSLESRPGIDNRKTDILIYDYSLGFKQREDGREDRFSPDVYIVTVSPPDARGFCSFGPYGWFSRLVAPRAKIVIGEVNPSVVFVGGDSYIHVSEIDYLVERCVPAKERGARPPLGITNQQVEKMGQLVASLIRDGDCIQVGGGEASEAVCHYLFDKKDLGIHSEVIQRSMIDLMMAGVVTGKRKNFHTNRAVGTGANTFTDPNYNEYVQNNPAFEIMDVEYVNNIKNIAANDSMVSIQTCLQVDLSGQVASETLGTQLYSAAGGQTSFAIGSMLSKGGRSIMVFSSTAKKGTISRIVPTFEPGTVVTVPRAWVDYVVTEYGVVNLQFKTLRQRAEALVSIAHPGFRDELMAQARMLYWPQGS